ncbi:MAG: DNA (cytosine-5-)-methyltransferase [Candidatus Saccharibacteria bacterium]|nr:DNA (cytosine-5-)-methyltransferase [Candidatus Saccharibacteria bacterium]
MTAKKTIKVFEGFAGYGGASFGLKRAKAALKNFDYKVIGYSEFDKFASKLFDANHKDEYGNPIKNWGDITKINPDELPDFDFFTGGFPCQPFSSAGMQLGTEDPYGRGAMLGHIIRICRVKKPKYLLLENVKGFTSGKFKPIHDQLVKDLIEMGYGTTPENTLAKAVLNSKDYGIPQNRERLWMFARLGGLPENFSMVPPTIESFLKMGDFLDFSPDKTLYLSDDQIAHLKVKHNIDSFVVKTPLCFDVYNKKIKTDGYSITITQPEHNSLRVIEPPQKTGKNKGKEIVRKMSVHEQFRLMGFDISRDLEHCEINFDGQSYSQLSKRAGNGWDVNVVGILLKHIWGQL